MGKDLEPIKPAQNLPASVPLPAPLQRWICSAGAPKNDIGRRMWEQPLACPDDIRPLLPAAIERHKAALIGASPSTIGTLIARLALHHPGQRTELEWQLVFVDMIGDFQHLPADILSAALDAHRRSNRFWPKSSEILAIAEPRLAERKAELERMEMLLGLPPAEEVSDEQRRQHAARCRLKPDDLDMLRWHASAVARGLYLATIGNHEIDQMIACGLVSREQAVAAGYC